MERFFCHNFLSRTRLKLNKKRKKEKICWANTTNFADSDVVIVGIPNEVGSQARRRGTSKAPDTIRRVSNLMDVYNYKETALALPSNGNLETKVYDYGNVPKKQIPQVFDKIVSSSKIPIAIGGDHSNTAQILKAISKSSGPISLVYFDAHPDFIGSKRNYYGSVIYDSLPFIDAKSSVLVGIRSPEKEELENIRKHDLRVITPFDVVEKGINEITKTILSTIKKNVYISFDMDCLDPAFAPGVSVPVPFGLTSQEAAYLVRKIVRAGIIGCDVMEVNPPHDLKDTTSHVASRLIGEIISHVKV